MPPKKPPFGAFAQRLFLAQKRYELRGGVELLRGEIARRVGMSEATVSLWFTGKAMPNVAQIENLAKLLGADPGWLAFGDQATVTMPDSGERRGDEGPPPPDGRQQGARGRR